MRESIQNTLTTIDTIPITDPTGIDWSQLTITQKISTHIVTTNDVMRPYMIAYQAYGNTAYTDVIMLINRIDNPFALKVGMELILPAKDDIDTFILDTKRKIATQIAT